MEKKSIEERVAVLEALVPERFRALEDARKLQFSEFMRRFKILNGEADRLLKMQAQYVPREVDAKRSQYIDSAIERLEAFRNNFIGRVALIAAISAVLAALLGSVVTAVILKVIS